MKPAPTKVLLVAAVLAIGLTTITYASTAHAQQAVCTAADGFSYNNSSFTFDVALWGEGSPPIFMPPGTTWEWSFTGQGTAELKFFEYPGGEPIVDFGTITPPQTVSHFFAERTDTDYRLKVLGNSVHVEWSCTVEALDIPSLNAYALGLLSLLLMGLARYYLHQA